MSLNEEPKATVVINPSPKRYIWKNVLGILFLALLLSGVSSIFLDPMRDARDNKAAAASRDVYTADCGESSLTLREYVLINRFEGSGEGGLDLLYASATTTATLFSEASHGFSDNYPILPPLNTKVPSILFEKLTPETLKGKIALRTVYVSPQTFSREEFNNISACLGKNLDNFYTARNNYLKKFGIGRYPFRFVAVTYVDQKDLEDYIHQLNAVSVFTFASIGAARNVVIDNVYMEDNGVVLSVRRGYLGSVFDLIPLDNKSPLNGESATDNQGEALWHHLQDVAANLVNYDGRHGYSAPYIPPK